MEKATLIPAHLNKINRGKKMKVRLRRHERNTEKNLLKTKQTKKSVKTEEGEQCGTAAT